MNFTLLYCAVDDIHRTGVMDAAEANHLRVVATGHVQLHTC